MYGRNQNQKLALDNVTMSHLCLEQLSRSLSSLHCIQTMYLYGVRCREHIDMCCIPALDLQKHNELEILELSDPSFVSLLLPLEGTRIRKLELDNVTMAHHGLEQLSRSLSSWSCIKELVFDGVRCREHTDMCCIPVLDLRKQNELEILNKMDSSFEGLLLPMDRIRIRELTLHKVTMAHHGLEQLSRSLPSWSCIQKLDLDGVRCSEHSRCCIPALDLRKHNELEILYKMDSSFEDLLLPKEGARFISLKLNNVTMTHHGLEQLSRSLSSWSCIKELVFDGVRCSEHTDMCCIPALDLWKQNELEILTLSDSSFEGLLLCMEGTRIRKLALDNVTMSHLCLEQLSRSLSSLHCIQALYLYGVRCREHIDMCCIPALDLQKHNELEILELYDPSFVSLLLPLEGTRIRKLELGNVTMAHHGLEQLSRSLSSWSCIKELVFTGVRCREHTDMCCIPVLDLRKQNELEILYKMDSSFEGLLLPMDRIRIRELTLHKVTMAHHGLEQLSRSLSSWFCIQKLKLDGVRCSEHSRCCIPALDLRKHNELDILYKMDSSFEDLLLPKEGARFISLKLNNVTMTHHGLEQLSRSLSSWSCIKELVFDGVRCSEHTDMCCIPALGLRKQNELEILTLSDSSFEGLLLCMEGTRIRKLALDNVTMSHLCLEQLSRSLSSLHCIQTLYLYGVRCREHIDMCCIPALDLQKHNELEILELSDPSFVSLLLPLEGTRIRKLELDNVTMAHHGLEQLSRSLSSWSCIKELVFDGVRCREHTDMCCIPVLDLRKQNELEILNKMDSSFEGLLLPMDRIRIRELTLHKVTMAHHGLEQLSRSLSSWSCIQKLDLDGVRCSEHSRCCIPALDLRKHNELEILYKMDSSFEDLLLPKEGARFISLKLNNVTMTHHGLEQLSRSLSSWSCIKELVFDGVRCSEHTDMCCIPALDLRKHNELEILTMSDSSFEGLLLCMEGTRIRKLALDNVTMSHLCLEQLYRSLSSLHCIQPCTFME